MTWIEDGCPEVTEAIEKGGSCLYAFLSRFRGEFQARRAAEEICVQCGGLSCQLSHEHVFNT